MKHADVLEALVLVKEEIDTERERILDTARKAMMPSTLEAAEKAIAYAKKMQLFVENVEALNNEWKKLIAEIDGATPEVKAIVQPRKLQQKHKTGYQRQVEKVSPKTNFTVKFPDGKVIEEPSALNVLVKAIEKLGPEKVEKVGLFVNGEPLVSKDKRKFQKYPTATKAISGGWYVGTQSSTKYKVRILKHIAKELKIDLIVTEPKIVKRNVNSNDAPDSQLQLF